MQKKGKDEEYSDFEVPEGLKRHYEEFANCMTIFMKEFKAEMKKTTKESPLPDDIIQAYIIRCRLYHLYCEEDLHYGNEEDLGTTREKFLKTNPLKDKEFSELRFTSKTGLILVSNHR